MEIHLFYKKMTCSTPLSIALFTSVLLLSACSSNDAYLDAKALPPVVVPDGLDKQALGQIYVVPKGDGRLATGEFAEPLPPALASRQTIVEPRIQTFQGKSWLVVPKEASATWSQLLIFLQSRQISTLKQNPNDAVIETEWVTEAAEDNQAYRYQLHLEAGLQPELTEIHAVNVQGAIKAAIPSAIPTTTQWPQYSESTRHELWFLQQIAKVISNQKALGDSLIASAISFSPKSASNSIDGEPVVDLLIGKERAYNVLLNSLNDSQFVTYDYDESAGVIYFNEDATQEKKSLTRKVAGFIYDIATVQFLKNDSPYPLEDILSNLPNEDSVKTLFPLSDISTKTLSGVPGYLLVLRQIDENKQRLYLRDGYGRPLPSAEAKVLLDTIKKQLY